MVGGEGRHLGNEEGFPRGFVFRTRRRRHGQHPAAGRATVATASRPFGRADRHPERLSFGRAEPPCRWRAQQPAPPGRGRRLLLRRRSGPLAESLESKRPSVRPGDYLLPPPIPSPLVSRRPESWDGDL